MSTSHIPNSTLRYYRERRNWTQEQAAEALLALCGSGKRGEVNARMISKWERGVQIPSLEYRKHLCRLYEVQSPEDLGFLKREDATDTSRQFPAPASSSLPSHLFVETQREAWLTHGTGYLAQLFDEGWTLESILDSLRVVLQSAEGMPTITRRMLLQVGGLAVTNGITFPTAERVSEEERTQLGTSLGKSISNGWTMFSTAGNAQVLAIGQAQLSLLQQTHSHLHSENKHIFYSSIYSLIGSAYFFQGCYAQAWQALEKAYSAAVEGTDVWNRAASLNWQATLLNSQNQPYKAIQTIEAALHLVQDSNEERCVRLKAHLLANWAINASMLRENAIMDEKLHASESFLEQISANEEFDTSHWHHVAGICAFTNKNHIRAIEHFEQALHGLPQNWLVRRFMSLIPLTDLYARERNRDACLAALKETSSVVYSKDASIVNARFASIYPSILDAFPQDEHIHSLLYSTNEQRSL